MVSSVIYKLTDPMIPEYSNMKIVTRLYNIANSRLKVTALTNFHKFRQGLARPRPGRGPLISRSGAGGDN